MLCWLFRRRAGMDRAGRTSNKISFCAWRNEHTKVYKEKKKSRKKRGGWGERDSFAAEILDKRTPAWGPQKGKIDGKGGRSAAPYQEF